MRIHILSVDVPELGFDITVVIRRGVQIIDAMGGRTSV